MPAKINPVARTGIMLHQEYEIIKSVGHIGVICCKSKEMPVSLTKKSANKLPALF
jgi:hypothetical protein